MMIADETALLTLSENLKILRLDVLHPGLGNKFYKLLPNFEQARSSGLDTILSFGGAWSNHIYTLAKLGAEQGIRTIGVIRGEQPRELSATLNDALGWGMQLEFISRSDYAQQPSAVLLDAMRDKYGPFLMVPEGGSNLTAVQGCKAIVSDLDHYQRDYDVIVLPVGTGGTLAGVVLGLEGRASALGIAVLKGAGYLSDSVATMLHASGSEYDNWSLNTDFHCGGYAKFPDYLRAYLDDFEARYGVMLDPVYTGKMMFAIERMSQQGLIAKDKRVVAIHTGGLQGRRGFDLI